MFVSQMFENRTKNLRRIYKSFRNAVVLLLLLEKHSGYGHVRQS